MESTLVQLIQYFEEFEKEKSSSIGNTNIASFSIFLQEKLANKRVGNEIGLESWNNLDRQTLEEMAISLIGKLGRFVDNYARKNMPKSDLPSLEEFVYLIVLTQRKTMTKTALIIENGHQITTGTEIIKRLIKRGFILQEENPTDKRSVNVGITAAGFLALQSASKSTKEIAQISSFPLNDDELKSLISLTRKLERFHDDLFRNQKNEDISLLLKELKTK